MAKGLPPPEHPSPPRRPLPLGAADCHAHVFGPFERFPLLAESERPYTPHELPGGRYLAMLDEIGMRYGVLVQPAAHGTDCGALLYALSLAPERLRGVALLDAGISDAELERLHQGGVRGARFSRPPPVGGGKGFVSLEVLERLAPRLKALGWHAQIWAPSTELREAVRRLAPHGLQLVIDHMGMFDPQCGVDDVGFRTILELLAEGQIWLKLTAYRLSSRFPDYEEILPFHCALLAANAERLIWGSDWPHVHLTHDMPDVGHLVDLFEDWTPDSLLRRRIWVQNPQRLYGFE